MPERIYPDGHYAVIRSVLVYPAPPHVADAFGVEPGEPMIRREREHHAADGSLLSVSVSWFSAGLKNCGELLQRRRIPEGTANYIAARTGRTVARRPDVVTTVPATQEYAEALKVEPGTEVQLVLTSWVDENETVVEMGESLRLLP